MSNTREEIIKLAKENGYTYTETPTQIDVSKIEDEAENTCESITLDKENNEIQLWVQENGSGKSHTLNGFELDILALLGRFVI